MAVTAAAAAALVLAACGSGTGSLSSDVFPAGAAPAGAAASSVPASASQTLSETGSSLMAPLFALWAPAYHSRFSQVTLRTASSSSGEGISSAAAGKADIGASDAFLSPATLARYSHLVNIPLAVAALMVVYDVPGVSPSAHLRLDGKVLTQVFTGKISRWDDPAIAALNPGVKLPGAAIVPVHRADSSGSTFLLPTARAIQAALASFTSTPASETISLVDGSAAQAYPIINYEYAVVNTSQPSATRAQDLRAFLTWAVTSGTAQLARVNFQPLPPPAVTLSDAQIDRIRG